VILCLKPITTFAFSRGHNVKSVNLALRLVWLALVWFIDRKAQRFCSLFIHLHYHLAVGDVIIISAIQVITTFRLMCATFRSSCIMISNFEGHVKCSLRGCVELLLWHNRLKALRDISPDTSGLYKAVLLAFRYECFLHLTLDVLVCTYCKFCGMHPVVYLFNKVILRVSAHNNVLKHSKTK
jgi:hypothetical protein